MTADTAGLLIAVGAALVVVGMAMLAVSAARATRRPARAARPPAGSAVALTFTSILCGVIAGVQWAVLSQATPGVVWVVVLCLPAFLAAASVARLLIVLRLVHRQRRQMRAQRRERRWHR